MEYSEFIIFADESGDIGVKSIDPHYPVFVFSCCVFRRQEYCRATLPAIAQLKLNYFGNQDIILRSRNIRIGQPPFDFPYDRHRRSAFMRDLSAVIDDANFTIIAAVIDKPKLLRQRPNPTPLDRQAFRLCVNRIYSLIANRGPDNLRIPFIIESRGQKENDALQQEFWSIQSRRVATNRIARRKPAPNRPSLAHHRPQAVPRPRRRGRRMGPDRIPRRLKCEPPK